MCISIYIFSSKQKAKNTRRQKTKETKEEKRISVENLTGFDNIVCEFVLCTSSIREFLLVVHVNLMKFMCNEKNVSIFILRQHISLCGNS